MEVLDWLVSSMEVLDSSDIRGEVIDGEQVESSLEITSVCSVTAESCTCTFSGDPSWGSVT